MSIVELMDCWRVLDVREVLVGANFADELGVLVPKE